MILFMLCTIECQDMSVNVFEVDRAAFAPPFQPLREFRLLSYYHHSRAISVVLAATNSSFD